MAPPDSSRADRLAAIRRRLVAGRQLRLRIEVDKADVARHTQAIRRHIDNAREALRTFGSGRDNGEPEG